MSKVYIIAEAGVNHNGDIDLAKRMVLEAKKAGADAVKFQTFVAESLVSISAPKAEYQKQTTGTSDTQLEMLKKLELSFEQFALLKEYSEEVEIDFLSTPFDFTSIDFLNDLGMPSWKIPSGEITNKPYLKKIAATGKPIILSTGMSTLQEIQDALAIFHSYDKKDITLLHCNTEYPTPFEDVNLRAMGIIKDMFQVKVGYSDHTLGITIPIAAVAMGACIIEKHFTLERTLPGPDHKASLEPAELTEMVSAIRQVEVALGREEKQPTKSEEKNRIIARKSIVAKREIKEGELLTEENLTTKRPGDGLSPMLWEEVIGLAAVRDFVEDEQIKL